MAVRTRKEILEMVRTRIGDDTSDDAIAFTEDISDTIADMETRANGGGENWEQKYKDNDKMWREKYRNRFFDGKKKEKEEFEDEADDKPLTYENLFKEGQ